MSKKEMGPEIKKKRKGKKEIQEDKIERIRWVADKKEDWEREEECNDKAGWDDFLITLNVKREWRELDRVPLWIWLPTYTQILFVYMYA